MIRNWCGIGVVKAGIYMDRWQRYKSIIGIVMMIKLLQEDRKI
jgi:hypothetical protein